VSEDGKKGNPHPCRISKFFTTLDKADPGGQAVHHVEILVHRRIQPAVGQGRPRV